MKPKSLRHTLALMMVVLIVTCSGVISQFILYRYSVNLMEIAVSRARTMAYRLALEATDKVLINDIVALHKSLEEQLSSDSAVAYILVMNEGRVLAHTFSNGVPKDLLHVNAAEDPRFGSVKKLISGSGERFIDVAWPIFDGKAGTLRLGYSEAPYRLQIRKLWIQLSAITLAIIALALLLSHFFLKRLTAPLQSLTAASEKIEEGTLHNIHMDIKGPTEVVTLSLSFKRMINRLNDSMQRLAETNLQLNQKNRELERAHHRLLMSFSISQELAALPDLGSVGGYLLQKCKELVQCQDLALLVFSTEGHELYVCADGRVSRCHADTARQLHEKIGEVKSSGFLSTSGLDADKALAHFSRFKRAAVFPFHYHENLQGSLLVGCPENCACEKKEIQSVGLILNQVAGAIRRVMVIEERRQDIRSCLEMSSCFEGFIGRAPQMQVVYHLIEDVAPTDATVLIQGESGTGKELAARAIHERSARKNKPFVVINCSAYPASLLESELFGHEKGAFTGAVNRKSGRFELADGGTVFLDEIGEITPSAQIKLLRVLQSQKFERLGGQQSVTVDVRILAATNKNLLQEVQAGEFREDLFYRLNVIPINMPPLRERRNDIPLLAEHFLKRFATEQNKSVQAIEHQAMRKLLAYRWPGNVRELENSIEHAVVLAKDSTIGLTDLPASILNEEDLLASALPRQNILVEHEEKTIRRILKNCGWNKTEAAVQLGISRSTLYEKMKKYQIVKDSLH